MLAGRRSPTGKEEVPDPQELLSRLPEPTQRRMKPADFSPVSPAAFLQMVLTLTLVPADSQGVPQEHPRMILSMQPFPSQLGQPVQSW